MTIYPTWVRRGYEFPGPKFKLIEQQPENQMKNSEQLKQAIRETQISLNVLQEELQEAIKAERWWEFPGGTHAVVTYRNGLGVCELSPGDHYSRNKALMVNNVGEADSLKNFIHNVAILWQLANDLNPDGWTPDWDDEDERKYQITFNYKQKDWVAKVAWSVDRLTPAFKTRELAEKAVEILKNQAKELGVKL